MKLQITREETMAMIKANTQGIKLMQDKLGMKWIRETKVKRFRKGEEIIKVAKDYTKPTLELNDELYHFNQARYNELRGMIQTLQTLKEDKETLIGMLQGNYYSSFGYWDEWELIEKAELDELRAKREKARHSRFDYFDNLPQPSELLRYNEFNRMYNLDRPFRQLKRAFPTTWKAMGKLLVARVARGQMLQIEKQAKKLFEETMNQK